MQVSFQVADNIPLSLTGTTEEFTRDLRFLSALMWYRKNKLSLGKAAELAGYSKLEFIARIQMENEPIFDYRDEELTQVFADVAKLP